jgi:catechol 2,3-dioxygenase-like lactoylglutathione lyase family enzyme
LPDTTAEREGAIPKSADEGSGASPPEQPGYAGIDHLGFQVDDVDETCRRLEAAGATALTGRVDLRPAAGTARGAYYERKHAGPDDQLMNVSGHGWVGTSA